MSRFEYASAPESKAIANIATSYGLFIGGKFVEPKQGKSFNTFNPATEELLSKIGYADKTDIDAAQAVRADARDGWLAVLEGDGGFASPESGRCDDVRGGEERVERLEVGVVGGDGHRRVIGVFREQAAFPRQRLRDGNRHAIAGNREAVDREATFGALRIRGQQPRDYRQRRDDCHPADADMERRPAP